MAKTKTLTMGERDTLGAQAREIEMQRDRVAHAVSSFKSAIPDVQSRIDKFTGICKAAEGVLKLAAQIPEDVASKMTRETGSDRYGTRTLTQNIPCARTHLREVASGLLSLAEGRVTELTDVLANCKKKLAENEEVLERVQADLDRAMEALA